MPASEFRTILILLILFIAPCGLHAAVFPKEGSVLNYRLIGFSLPFENAEGKYKIEIAAGYYNNADSFEQHIISTTKTDKNKAIIEVPDFHSRYTWRAVDISKKKENETSQLYHFSTGYTIIVDTQICRVRVTKHAEKCMDGYVFFDALGLLCDMDGRPVWYLPGTKYTAGNQVRDLKLSPFGTITFMFKPSIYEINYNGDTVWQNTGEDDTIRQYAKRYDYNYHHEFTRLANGHYMVLGSELSPCSILNDKKIATGDIVEYDEHKKVVWKWRSMDYILKTDLKDYLVKDTGMFDFHDNSFYFDEQNKVVYMSFRDVNRVIKIKYPDGDVLSSFEAVYDNNGNPSIDTFRGQHAVKVAPDGALYLFDNGTNNTVDPKVLVFSAPDKQQETPKLLWEYDCDVKNILGSTRVGPNPGGGNAELLPDNSMFISLGLRCGASLIASHDKEILWCGIPEVHDRKHNQWITVLSYRSSIISRKDLETLISNSEQK